MDPSPVLTDWSTATAVAQEDLTRNLAEQAELLEIVTYGFAAHQRAHHIEEVGVRNVPHPRGHPPAEGGVHEFNKLFVERKVIQKLGKKSPKLWFNSSKYLRFIWFNSRK